MKVFTVCLTLFLCTETIQAYATANKQVEPFMELKINHADGPLHTRDQENSNDTALHDEEKSNVTKKNATPNEGEPLSEMEFYNAKFINTSNPNHKEDGDLLLRAGLFEGDIAGVNEADLKEANSKKAAGYSALRDEKCLWPKALVPYVIADTFDIETRILIARSFLEYHIKTCIRFVPKTDKDEDYVYIMEGKGCFAMVGRVGGAQNVSIGKECHSVGLILHELMHAIGFWHEQSRADRDDYVTIVWDNIDKTQVSNFKKYTWDYIQSLGEKYDLGSIMHYRSNAFALREKEPTIIPKEKGKVIGQCKGFSEADLRKINALYKCKTKATGRIAPDCEDTQENCADITSGDGCGKDPIAWAMRPVCMKSCGLCGSECVDHTDSAMCENWSKKGLCDKDQGYMKNFCKKTCKVCT